MNRIRVAAVIPARMASSRFPGKPLISVRGLPMVEHVRRRALLCRRFSEVVVATCDEEIAAAVRGYGGKAVMTSLAHPGATDRVAEAAMRLDCTHLINVQGDQILVLPADLERMIQVMESEPEIPAWNAVARIESEAELRDRSVVKCAVSVSGRVLFCAREVSHPSNGERFEPYRRVLGVLGYRREFLERFRLFPRTPLEMAEAVDQSRIIEHDVPLKTVEFSKGYPEINEEREVGTVQEFLRLDRAQQRVLEEVLAG
ncbi:MAG: 3-deoxy-manno-octulosonate cytidylyltransferase [Candidatus Omnitrophica bacterium]|nr:3-deoxy-manno-octulosonate cytidylyltransferase [Candidatus Omnitrophota bacterium]